MFLCRSVRAVCVKKNRGRWRRWGVREGNSEEELCERAYEE